MVVVNIFKENDRINGISVDGHANYSKPGTDIVCAAVSALVFTTIASIEELTDTRIKHREKEGHVWLSVRSEQSWRSVLLLDAFSIGAHAIATEYPQCVIVREHQEVMRM